MFPNTTTLLISPSDIKNFGLLDINVDEHICTSTIKLTQDKWIRRIIGDKLLNKLIALIDSEEINLIENECYKELLDGYIFHIMAWHTLGELCMRLAEKVRNFGVGRVSDDRVYPDQFDDHRKVARWYHDQADLYTTNLAEFLTCKCSCFPELKEVHEWWEKKPEKSNITHSFIYFPGKGNKCGCR